MMELVFWDHEGVLYTEYLRTERRGRTVTKEMYVETLYNLQKAIKARRPGLLTKGVIILHNNARAHTVAITMAFLTDFGWITFQHPPYSPDLISSDYYLSSAQNVVGTQIFVSNEDSQTRVNAWFKNLYKSFFARGTELLVRSNDKCLNCDGDYVET